MSHLHIEFNLTPKAMFRGSSTAEFERLFARPPVVIIENHLVLGGIQQYKMDNKTRSELELFVHIGLISLRRTAQQSGLCSLSDKCVAFFVLVTYYQFRLAL